MSTLPCMRDENSGDDIGPSDEMLFLLAIGIAPASFDWRSIPPEERGAWARRVQAWNAARKAEGRTTR